MYSHTPGSAFLCTGQWLLVKEDDLGSAKKQRANYSTTEAIGHPKSLQINSYKHMGHLSSFK